MNMNNHPGMILIPFVLIRLVFARSNILAIWEIKEIVSIVRLVYYTLIDNKHVLNWRHCQYGIQHELLQQVHLGELDIVNSLINERLNMSEELLVVDSDPADDTLSTSGMAWEVSRRVFRSWMLPLMGVVIALIDCTDQLFTYSNFSLIWTNF